MTERLERALQTTDWDSELQRLIVESARRPPESLSSLVERGVLINTAEANDIRDKLQSIPGILFVGISGSRIRRPPRFTERTSLVQYYNNLKRVCGFSKEYLKEELESYLFGDIAPRGGFEYIINNVEYLSQGYLNNSLTPAERLYVPGFVPDIDILAITQEEPNFSFEDFQSNTGVIVDVIVDWLGRPYHDTNFVSIGGAFRDAIPLKL